MLIAAHDAAEAGLVSAAAAALTEGVLRTMLFAKLKLASLVLTCALLTAGAAVGVGAYGYQRPRPAAADAPDGDASAAAAGDEERVRDPDREKVDPAERLASYADKLNELAREARRQQDRGDRRAASETTRKIEQLAREWRGMLDPPAADTPKRASDIPAAARLRRSDPAPRTPEVLPPSAQPRPNRAWPKPRPSPRARELLEPVQPAERSRGSRNTAGSADVESPAIPTPARAGASSETDRRLDALERKLDRVLRAVELEKESRARSGTPVSPGLEPIPSVPPTPARPPVPPRPPQPPVQPEPPAP